MVPLAPPHPTAFRLPDFLYVRCLFFSASVGGGVSESSRCKYMEGKKKVAVGGHVGSGEAASAVKTVRNGQVTRAKTGVDADIAKVF